MKHTSILLLLSVSLFVNSNISRASSSVAREHLPVESVIKRVLGEKSRFFECRLISPEQGKDVFEIESLGDRIVLGGSSQPAIGYAFNWYLTQYCHCQFSRVGEQLALPAILPKVSPKVRKISPYDYRYFYNYCTYNYSMSFWDWSRWEKEIDWLVLHGVNMPLSVIGTEAVWQNTLRAFNVSDDAIRKFIPGPAYTAWWLMGNLEGWGGPVSQAWIDHQASLEQHIVKRMRSLGMTPVFQGFYGMVPDTLRTLFASNKIYYGGIWAGDHGFRRPAYLDPSDPLFAKMAAVFYSEQEKLYGKTTFYGGDPFHEGGNTEGIDITRSATLIQQAMQQAHPGSVWALQGWWENPTDKLLAGIDKKHALVLDLYAEGNPQWERRKGYDGTPWAWCCLLNFGGRIGMYGRMEQVANEARRALESPYGKNLKGIGMMMEGDETNPINFELLFDAAWSNGKLDVAKWVDRFVDARYGVSDDKARQAWQIISKTALSCPHAQEGTSQSIFCGRGDTVKMNAWPYGTIAIYYPQPELQKALSLMLACGDRVKRTDTYRYDLTDLTRQILANYGQAVYAEIMTAYRQHDKAALDAGVKQFLQLLDDQERILSTQKEFLLGNWLEAAKSVAPTPAERSLFEYNARALITVWGNKGVAEDLHEYANREWAGMIGSFYKPRWEAFFSVLKQRLEGKNLPLPDYYLMEEVWTKQRSLFPSEAVGDSYEIAKELYGKYFEKRK
jgi:alpha-N-acetylglucosaminidase